MKVWKLKAIQKEPQSAKKQCLTTSRATFFIIPLTLRHFLSSLFYLMSCTKKRQTMERRYVRGDAFLHELLLNYITLYQKKQKRLKIEVFERIAAAIFTQRHTCINKPCWQSGEITFSCIVWSWQCSFFRGTDSILYVFLFIFFVTLSEPKKKQRRKNYVTEI